MNSLSVISNDSTGRFAVMVDGRVAFESYRLDAKERGLLKEVIRSIDEQAWASGHDAAVLLVKEFSAALHVVRAKR